MSKISKKQVSKFSSLLPEKIAVRVHRSQDGGFSAEVVSYSGVFTQGDTFSELIEMINDAVYTYFEIPKNVISFMPTYLPQLL